MVKTLFVLLSLTATSLVTAQATPFADIHLHYNWTQKSVTSVSDISAALDKNNVAFAVISSTPTEQALLVTQQDKRVIALFSPYTHEHGKRTWFRDEDKVLEKARKGLQQGLYEGIGEVHFMAGFKPRHDNAIARGLFKLADEFKVPVLIHVDTSHVAYYKKFCDQFPGVNFLLAHAGGILRPEHIEQILQQCPNTWVELSARDPWRYDRFIPEDGVLPETWKKLFLAYPERFMTGTDPVWSVTKTQRWDDDDEGWQHYDKLLQFHRNWLMQLPADVEKKIRLDNALRFFGQR